MADEIWMPVVGFEDRYEVSNMGGVTPSTIAGALHGKSWNWIRAEKGDVNE